MGCSNLSMYPFGSLNTIRIEIIQGDSYTSELEITDESGEIIDHDLIQSVYFTSAKAQINKKYVYNESKQKYCLFFSSDETYDLNKGNYTFDVTVYFVDPCVNTKVYKGDLLIKEKTNDPLNYKPERYTNEDIQELLAQRELRFTIGNKDSLGIIPGTTVAYYYVANKNYRCFECVKEYIGYYVEYKGFKTLVTCQNKNTLGIRPGETIAYDLVEESKYVDFTTTTEYVGYYVDVDGIKTKVTDSHLLDAKFIHGLDLKDTYGYYTALNKENDYLYKVNYEFIDYDYAIKFFEEQQGTDNIGACSSIRNGNFYGRNLDWIYSDNVEFVVQIPRNSGRFASVGVTFEISDGTNKLSKEFVESREYSKLYKILPFKIVDGINEKGVVCNTNVVPTEKNNGNIIYPSGTVEKTISCSMLPRYILDNFDTAEKAVQYVSTHMALYSANADGYDRHFMVADKDNTYLIEFVDNEIVVSDISDKPYMTNFYLNGVEFNADGKVYTPETQTSEYKPTTTNNITPHGAGLERYNLIVDNYSSTNTKNGMRSLLNQLFYTKTYSTAEIVSNPFWYSEYVGGILTVDSEPDEFSIPIEISGIAYENRSRVETSQYFGTWQTNHSCVYDIENKKLYIVSQQDGVELNFDFNFTVIKTSQLENDGDGESPFATEDYVEEHGNKVEGADVNGVSQEVVNKIIQIEIDKNTVGLGNVDNTSDLNKPISTATQNALNTKVDKVAGKGLSTNDFTNTLKNKLDGIEEGAEVNVLEGIKNSSGQDLTIIDKKVQLSKGAVGLGNVDNTSDANKPISDATQDALDVIDGNITTLSNGLEDAEQSIQELDTEVTNISEDLSELENEVADILDLIPEEASAENQLADKNYVDENAISKYEISVSGTEGFFTDEQYSLLMNNNKNAIIVNSGERYYLVEEVANSYRRYVNVNIPQIDSVSRKEITVQIGTTNTKYWVKQESVIPEHIVVVQSTGFVTLDDTQSTAVPMLTTQQVTDIYNAIGQNQVVYVKDMLGANQTKVLQRAPIDGSNSIYLVYLGRLLLTYKITNNSVVITYKESFDKTYLDKSYAPLSFVGNLYGTLNTGNIVTLSDTPPTANPNNILQLIGSTNTEYIWTNPSVNFVRKVSVNTTLVNTNSLTFTLKYKVSRAVTISWGAKVQYSTDNIEWEDLSSNQSFNATTISNIDDGISTDITVFMDKIEGVKNIEKDSYLRILLFKKQGGSAELTTNLYFGVTVDNAYVCTFAQFNFANVTIDTAQIKDGSVTKQKLSSELIGELDNKLDASSATEMSIANTVMARDENGRSQVELPSTNKDIANKLYVDNISTNKLDKSTDIKNYSQVYTRTSGKNSQPILQETKALTYENISGGGTVPIRNASNNIQVGVATNDNDATNKSYVDAGLSEKVDKESGKGLSTNDYTTTDKNKLADIASGATKVESSSVNGNIKINGTQTNVYTLPNTVVEDDDYVHTDNNFTNNEKSKLAGIEAGAEVNDPDTVIDASYVHTDNNFTTAEKNKLAGLNQVVGMYEDDHWVEITIGDETKYIPQGGSDIDRSTLVERTTVLPTATAQSSDFVSINSMLYFKIEKDYDEPVVEGDTLALKQVYKAVQNNDTLEVE